MYSYREHKKRWYKQGTLPYPSRGRVQKLVRRFQNRASSILTDLTRSCRSMDRTAPSEGANAGSIPAGSTNDRNPGLRQDFCVVLGGAMSLRRRRARVESTSWIANTWSNPAVTRDHKTKRKTALPGDVSYFAPALRTWATRRDFLRAAVFFLMIPRFAALSIAWKALERDSGVIAFLAPFTESLSAFARTTLNSRFLRDARWAFFAELVIAMSRYHTI